MLVQIKLAGLALAGKMLISKSKSVHTRTANRPMPRRYRKPRPRRVIGIRRFRPNPLQKLAQALSSSLSGIVKKPPKEDYQAIVKGFLPENAILLTPQYPLHAGKIHLADLDGDLENELITCYKLNDEITILALKKRKEQWIKMADFKRTEYKNINYIGFADILGKGNRQLLVGWKAHEKSSDLYAYSMQDGKLDEQFIRTYNRMEVIEYPTKRGSVSKAELAIWSKDDHDTYNIEVLGWNGTALEPIKDVSRYYFNSVVPYYGQKVKQMPENPVNWYNLACSLEKAGMYKDALISVEMGRNIDSASTDKEKFLTLKYRILKNMR